MDERTMLVSASIVALIGLVLLFLVQPSEDEGFHLRGVVLEDRGTYTTVATNVTLIARDVRRGDIVNTPVFWSDDSFVAVPKKE